jgi:hypothetical protein
MRHIKSNAYRIIGILAGTSTREEHTKVKKLKMYVQADEVIPLDYFFSIIGKQSRSIDDIEKAASKLNLNDDRIISALFWFFEGNKVTDEPAFDLLKENDLKEAATIWENLIDSSSEVTKKNASAFSNLGTIYLSENKFKKGLNLKLAFLESDYTTTLISKVTDETFKISKTDLQIRFLKTLFEEIKSEKSIEVSELLEILNTIDFSAKKVFLEQFIDEPIKAVEEEISKTKIKISANKASGSIVGKDLINNTSQNLKLIKSIIGKTAIKYTNIADKVANQVSVCSSSYFNHYKHSNTDPSEYAMDLFIQAKKIAEGSVTKQRIQDNIENLEEWIQEKPERDKQNRITADLDKLVVIFKRYDEKAETISNATGLITETKPLLNNIKSVLGSDDDLYLKLSTRIASQVLAYIIEEVNQAQSNIQYSFQLDKFKLVLRNAIILANTIKAFDLEYDFKVNRFNENYKTLYDLCLQLNVSTSSVLSTTKTASQTTYSPRPTPQPTYTTPRKTNGEGSNWLGWVVAVIIFFIVIKSCNASNNNYNNNSNYDDAAVDTTSIVADTAASYYPYSDTTAALVDTVANEMTAEAYSSPYVGNQLENGASPLDDCFGSGLYSGNATLTIKNGGNSDAIVCLYSIGKERTIRNEYVQKNSTFKMSSIPQGYYTIRVFYGNDWNPNLENSCNTYGNFESDVNFTEFDNEHFFEDSSRGYTNATVTLYEVSNGNASSSEINQSTFFNK